MVESANTSIAPVADPADLTVGDLVKRLKPKDLYAIAVTMATLLSATVAAGWAAHGYLGANTADNRPIDAIAATQEGNEFQARLRSRPAIQTFERFLDAAATERWSEAYVLTSSAWRSQHNQQQADDLAREFRMTHKHRLRYFIPREIGADREVYDIDFEFADFIPSMPVRESLSRSRIGDVLKPDKVDSLARELLTELPRHYSTAGRSHAELEAYVKRFTADLTIRDCAIRDDLIEVLGSHDHLKLKPIVITETYQGKPAPIQKRRFVTATMVKDSGDWKMHSYDSFMVEKR